MHTLFSYAEHFGDEVVVERVTDGLELAYASPDGIRYLRIPEAESLSLLRELRLALLGASTPQEIETFLAS